MHPVAVADPESSSRLRGAALFDLLAEAAREGEVELAARGDSMGEALPAGARVRVRAARRYRAGDVVVFLNGAGDLVAHRVLGRLPGRSGWRLVTRGDRAPIADGLVPVDRVLGRLVGGEVDPRLLQVPLADRGRACGRFLGYLLGRILG